MEERHPDRVRDTERTTIVHTGGGGGGGGAILVAIILLLVLGALFFLFGRAADRNPDGFNVNVNIDAPDAAVPEVRIPAIEVPTVNVNQPASEGPERTNENRAQ